VIRFTGTVEFKDGRQEGFECGSMAQAEYELYAHRHGLPASPEGAPVLWTAYMAYIALDVEQGFDVWRKGVLNVELENASENGVPPTLPAPSAGSSSSSPSPLAGA
jgi:hypothetical protein